MAKNVKDYLHNSYALSSRLIVELAVPKSEMNKDKHNTTNGIQKTGDKNLSTETTEETDVNSNKIDNTYGNENATVDQRKRSHKDMSNKDNKNAYNDDTRKMANDTDDSDSDSFTSSSRIHINKEKSTTKDTPTARKNIMTDLDFLKSKMVQKDVLVSDDDTDTNDKNSKDKINEGHVVSDSSDNDSSSVQSSDVCDNDSSSVPSSASDSSDSEPDNGTYIKDNTNTDNDTNKPDTLLNPNRLFIRNLPFTSTAQKLRQMFDKYGHVLECHVPLDNDDETVHNKGYAFINYTDADSATNALNALNQIDFQGRVLHVLRARKHPNDLQTNQTSSLTFKKKRELERRSDAINTNDQPTNNSNNASLVRSDAVMDNLSHSLNLSKGEIFNVKENLSSGKAAVRLALGETQVIDENDTYFKNHGICFHATQNNSSSTNDPQKRSKRHILIKNLPFDTHLQDIQKLCYVGNKCENPKQILLAPSRTTCVLEYEKNGDAKRFFRERAYRRFKAVPLYLEWLSLNAFVNPDKDDDKDKVKDKEHTTDDNHTTLDLDFSQYSQVTLYIKNLNFDTTETQLCDTFETLLGGTRVKERLVHVRSVRIPTKTLAISHRMSFMNNDKNKEDDASSSRQVSMGFGFVECALDKDDTTEANKLLQKVLNQPIIVDGHTLEFQISKTNPINTITESSNDTTAKTETQNTKLMVRNVPFQANKADLLQLFGVFGHLKNVRLPKAYGGRHRGFAFVEFAVGREAECCKEKLKGTHLYGRHLVLEWASVSTL